MCKHKSIILEALENYTWAYNYCENDRPKLVEIYEAIKFIEAEEQLVPGINNEDLPTPESSDEEPWWTDDIDWKSMFEDLEKENQELKKALRDILKIYYNYLTTQIK
jgi:hypothetical protein